MSVAMYKSLPPAPFHYDKGPAAGHFWQSRLAAATSSYADDDSNCPGQADIWNLIQSQAAPPPTNANNSSRGQQKPYVHPLVRRSSGLLSQKSLEVCTESLGSETGSDGFSDQSAVTAAEGDVAEELKNPPLDNDREVDDDVQVTNKQPASRSFPPPIPSIARYRGRPSLQMRPHRLDGRLVVEAVPIPSATVLRAHRHGGRLLLSFADADTTKQEQEQEQQVLEDKENEPEMAVDVEEEEEVEVVDRGTMVEVKVSTQPQVQSGGCGGASKKVHRSAFVINKFVSSEPLIRGDIDEHSADAHPRKTVAGSTTTAAAAVVAASALSATSPNGDGDGENKLLVTAKRRRSKEELLHHMRRCGQLRRPLFIWEPWCIATSS